MQKRTFKLGGYDTAADGLWTLTGWDFPEPEQLTHYIDVPGRAKGPLDMSTVLTDGEPVYGSRPLSITLETSEGDRLERMARISDMVNRLHGRRVEIVLPDDPFHYAVGRLAVKQLYNDLAHASVEVTGICEPWLYARDEKRVTLTASAAPKKATLRNAGALTVLPDIVVTAEEGASVLLAYGSASVAMSAGKYTWSDLLLKPGDHVVTYSGAGTVTITYREAVLR